MGPNGELVTAVRSVFEGDAELGGELFSLEVPAVYTVVEMVR